jgi:hypothetical protein
MYALARKQRDTHEALAVGVTLIYAVIACVIPLLHSDDCPAARGIPLSSAKPCPACMFLANPSSTDAHVDLTLILTDFQAVTKPASNSTALVASLCADCIVLRGPPHAALS